MDKPKHRRIYLSEQFNQESVKKIIREIIDINEDDERLEKEFMMNYDLKWDRLPIEIYIDSYGGSVYQCLGLIDIIDKSKTPVHTIVSGCAISCGFLLLISGHKRFAYKNSTLMYHQLSSGKYGTLQEIEESVEELKRLNKLLKNHTLKRTKISKEKLKECHTNKLDWYITSEDALKLEIIDEIL